MYGDTIAIPLIIMCADANADQTLGAWRCVELVVDETLTPMDLVSKDYLDGLP